MNNDIKNEILALLRTSSVSFSYKKNVRELLPFMNENNLQKVYEALSREKQKFKNLFEKKKRIALKYQTMIEKIVEIQLKKEAKKMTSAVHKLV